MMFKVIAELGANKQPVLALVVGGGAIAKSEVLRAVRNNISLLVIAGSGGFADEIAKAKQPNAPQVSDPALSEIVADGRIELVKLESQINAIERVLVGRLGGNNLLLQAWIRFAEYDSNATLQQHRFNGIQVIILVVGVVATALAIIKQVKTNGADPSLGSLWWYVKYVLIGIPISITILVTAANKFKQGNKWLLLRGGAETIKREIYRYRSRTGDYSETVVSTPTDNLAMAARALSGGQTLSNVSSPPSKPTADQVLAQRVEEVTRRVMQTEVNASSLLPYSKAPFPPAISKLDDGFSLLTPDRYIEVRIDDQIKYYGRQTVRMERTVKRFQWAVYIIGGVGTLLAAINQQVWIALTTALAAAISTYLSYKQTENSLTKYNQAKTDLENIKSWWTALPSEERAKQASADTLVDHAERVLQSELDGWVQQMQNALAELRKGQPQAGEGGTTGTVVVKNDVAAATPTPEAQKATSDAGAEQPGANSESGAAPEEAKEEGDVLSADEVNGLDNEPPPEAQPDAPITGENGDGAANPNPEGVPPVSS